jgi:hypothetical protein
MPHDDAGEPQFGGATYGGATGTQFGGVDHPAAPYDAPWRVNYVRVDGLTETPTAIPGESASYNCVLLPENAFQDHIDRWAILRDRVRRGPTVDTWQTPDGSVHYREQHSAPDGAQLVEIAPLAPEHDAAGTPQDPPPGRDSAFQARYAVVTGGSISATRVPKEATAITLETTTIALGDEFPTRDALRDAREHNGF